MAEGGHLQENKPGKASLSPSRLLDCPICLEQMLQPKSLPCLHSFCEECLGTYIVTDLSGEMAAATSFPCPVCRKITSPVDPTESKETWARQFPSNSIVQEVNITKTMSDIHPLCGLCKKTKNIETPASYLCKLDGTLFCNSCKTNAHDFFHKICDTVTIDDMARMKPLSTTCSTHNEKMEWYCQDHRMIRCNTCIITEHRNCDAVMTVKEFCEKLTETSSLDKSFEMADTCMELMAKSCDDQDESIEQNRDVGLKSISDLRQRINAYLDMKQEEITQELISKHKAEKAKVDVRRQKCRRMKASMQSTREASRTAAQREDHIQMIPLFHRGQTEIEACNDLIDDISSEAVTIRHEIDSSLETISQTSTLSLGRINVDENTYNVPDGVKYVQCHETLSNSQIRKLRTILIKVPSDQGMCSLHGIVLMPTGNIVVSDYGNKCLKLFSSQGKGMNVLNINGYPRDVCLVDNSTVAVAVSTGEIGIHIVKVQDSMLRLSSVIKTMKTCHGITYVDGTFMVSTPNYVYRVGMDGKAQNFYYDKLPNACYYLVSCPNNKGTFARLDKGTFASLSTSTDNDVVVTELPTMFQTSIMRVGLVKNGMGIDVDREGKLYVCGQGSNNVIQMSPDGTQIRELLTPKDGIDSPRAISVCGDIFGVTNESSNTRNYIDVYQLF